MPKATAKTTRRVRKSSPVVGKKSAKSKLTLKPSSKRGASSRHTVRAKSSRGAAKVQAASIRRPARTGKSSRPPREVITITRAPNQASQPIIATEIEIVSHKYQVGQAVFYSAPTFGRAPANGNFVIVKLLPTDGDEHQYRIKSAIEAFERVAKESQLDNA